LGARTSFRPPCCDLSSPLVTTPRDYVSISPVVDNGDDFFLGIADEPSTVFVVHQPRLPWTAGATLERFADESTQATNFAVDRVGKRLYMLKDTAARTELNWFDDRAREFHPFLPGPSIRDVDFARDGRSIAYVRESDDTLWVASSDGSSARRIATPGMVNVELPRWSPDGNRLAFMAKLAEAPYRVFVTSASGNGVPVQASHGSGNQGAPTWSPDGRELIYGRSSVRKNATVQFKRLTWRPANRPRSQDRKASRQHDGLRMAVSWRPFERISTKSGSSIGGLERGGDWPVEKTATTLPGPTIRDRSMPAVPRVSSRNCSASRSKVAKRIPLSICRTLAS
jgi:dipeptidyl aminopeptidase/acylaminoacyl peptidase